MAAKKKTAKKAARKKPATRRTAARKTPATRARTRATSRQSPRRQPETLRLRDASPSLTVDDIQRSLDWYRDVLGFTEKERWEESGTLSGVELVAGTVSFYLMQDDWKKGRDRAKGEGFRLYCTTAQDVDALARQIRDQGGTLLQEPRDEPWGARAFALADPDGFKLTISSR